MLRSAHPAINANYAQELNTKIYGCRKDNSHYYKHTTLVPGLMAIWKKVRIR